MSEMETGSSCVRATASGSRGTGSVARPLLRYLLAAGSLFAAISGASDAASFYVTSDVPVKLGAGTYQTESIIRLDSGAPSLGLTLSGTLEIDALHRLEDGSWLFSVESPAKLGSLDVTPRDIVRYVPNVGYSYFLLGSAVGIPANSNIDAFFLVDGDPDYVAISFDIPTAIGGRTYLPADIALYHGGAFSIFFDSQTISPAIPLSTDLIAADQIGSLLLVAFDVPTTLGATTFLPGDIVSWNGSSFSLYERITGWPASNLVSSLSLLPSPGEVPPSLTVEPAPGSPGQLLLKWQPSCSVGAEDYAIYEGSLGGWYSHSAIDCSDDGHDLEEVITPSAGNRYYLVVPKNPDAEGSYGHASSGLPRPVGITRCAAAQVVHPCPP